MGYDLGDIFLLTLNQMEFHLVQNRKENCPHDHIPFNVKGNVVFSVLQHNAFAVPETIVSRHNGASIKDPSLNAIVL